MNNSTVTYMMSHVLLSSSVSLLSEAMCYEQFNIHVMMGHVLLSPLLSLFK